MANTTRRPRAGGSWLLTLFALLFVGVALVFVAWLGNSLAAYLRVQDWEESPATVVRADIKHRSDSHGRDWPEAQADYRYHYQGQNYTGNQICLDVVGSFAQDAIPELRKQAKSGVSLRCYVNPKRPTEAVLYRNLPWRSLLFQSSFVLVFGGFGFGLLALQRFGNRRKREEEPLAQAHPQEPWLWKRDWAEGVLRASTMSFVGPLISAAGWNAICAMFWFMFLINKTDSAKRSDDRVSWWFLIGATVIGVWAIGWAGVAVLRWRKYGRSVFHMASVPGVIGGQLAGVIRTAVRIEADGAFRLRLSCIHIVTTHRGSDSHTSREPVWQDEQVITRDLLRLDAGRSAIPVLFQIPFECRQTDAHDPDDMIVWKLEATAKTPGLDYRAEFEVPVFKTPESNPHFVVDRSLIAQYVAPRNPERDLREAGVITMPSPRGEGTRFVFPMLRRLGAALVFTLVALIFLGAAFFLPYMDFGAIPLAFGILSGLVAIFPAAAATWLWCYRSVADVSGRGLTVQGGLFGCGAKKWIAASNVDQIVATSNLKSDTMMYFDLVVICRDGRRITLGKWLPGKRLATALLDQIEQSLGKPQPAADR